MAPRLAKNSSGINAHGQRGSAIDKFERSSSAFVIALKCSGGACAQRLPFINGKPAQERF